MMNAMFMLLNSIEARGRFGRTLESLRQNSSKEVEFSHESFPFHLDNDDALRLGEAAMHSTYLQKLHLDVTAMTTAGTRTLITAIATLPRLQTLRVEGDTSTRAAKRLTATITNQFITAARQNPKVQHLHLSGTHFHSPGVADYCATLTHLLLCDVWHDATPSMVQRLAQGIRHSESLRTLTLVSVGDRVVVPLLEEGAKYMANLTTLHLSLPRFSEAVGKAVRSVLDTSSVQRFHLWGVLDLDTLNWGPVVQGLVQSSTARDVVLGACSFTDAGMQLLCSELLRNSQAGLHSLNLTQSIRSVEHWTAVCTALHRNTTLHILDLCNNPHVRCLRAAAALDTLLRRNKHLLQLDIDRNPNIHLSPRSLQYNQSLCHLDVSGTELGDAEFSHLCSIFATNTTIARFFVCGNELTTLQPLVTALQSNPNSALSHLYAHGNHFGDAAGLQLASLPAATTALRSLYLDHVGMGAEGVAALLSHSAFTLVSLRELDLRRERASRMEDALVHLSPQYTHVTMSIAFGPEGEEESSDDDDDEGDEDTADSPLPSIFRRPQHPRTRILNRMLLERGIHLQSLSLSSRWFRLDPTVVEFVLERNQSRDAVSDTRSLLPLALSKVHLSAAFWLLRRDPAAFRIGSTTSSAVATSPTAVENAAARTAKTRSAERSPDQPPKRQRTRR